MFTFYVLPKSYRTGERRAPDFAVEHVSTFYETLPITRSSRGLAVKKK